MDRLSSAGMDARTMIKITDKKVMGEHKGLLHVRYYLLRGDESGVMDSFISRNLWGDELFALDAFIVGEAEKHDNQD